MEAKARVPCRPCQSESRVAPDLAALASSFSFPSAVGSIFAVKPQLVLEAGPPAVRASQDGHRHGVQDQGAHGSKLLSRSSLPARHRGELATKVRYFGGKSTNVPRGQMGTKPAKVAHLPSWPTKAAKLGFSPETDERFAKRYSLRGRTKVAKVGPPRARIEVWGNGAERRSFV